MSRSSADHALNPSAGGLARWIVENPGAGWTALVGVLVLLGNVLRNTVLVGLQASHVGLSESAHQGVGLLVLALVCAAVCGLMAMRPVQAVPAAPAIRGLYGLD